MKMTENDSAKDKKRAALARLGKGFGALAVLIVLMLWLSGVVRDERWA